MKERIKELFQEAIDYADKTHTYTPEEGFNIQVWDKIRFEKFAELIIREYSYDVMNLHGAKPERVQYAAKCWGVEV